MSTDRGGNYKNNFVSLKLDFKKNKIFSNKFFCGGNYLVGTPCKQENTVRQDE
jgi:hypothetical protein